MSSNKNQVEQFFKRLQDSICKSLESTDNRSKFHEDLWGRDGGGGGRTRVIQHGNIIEKGGVNFSAVFGKLPENIKNALRVDESQFYATGVSIVIHPENPMVPIIHMNVRYFEMNEKTWWFGGGIDLTPHYIFHDDAKFFHQELKKVCDKHHLSYYPKFKNWADDYFFIKHRNETRGIGGIFFDRLTSESEKSFQDCFDFVKSVGNAFAPIYTELIKRNQDKKYNETHKKWQFLRRGRYVEFNLVYDKGTKFGLDTSGRIESILMSLPESASWVYNFIPDKGSQEEYTQHMLKKGIDWINS